MARSRPARPGLILGVLASGGTVVALQFTLVVPPLAQIGHDLGVGADDASWIVTATLLSSAVGTPIVTRLADLHGKRRLLLVTLLCLFLGSLIAAVGATFPLVVLGRAISGVAIALMPIGISILRDQSASGRIGGAVALMSATMAIGNSLALPLSGLIVEYLDWRMLFWIMCGLGVAMSAAVWWVVPADRGYATDARFDVLGAVVLSVVLVAALLVISKGSTWGWTSPLTIACGILALVLFALWVPWELRVSQPMVDLRTAVIRPVLLTNTATFFVAIAMFTNMLMTTQVVQVPVELGGLGGTPLQGGLAMVPSTVAMIAVAPLSGRLLDRFGGRPMLFGGAALLVAAYLLRLFWHDSAVAVVVGATIVGLGSALAFSATPVLIMSAVPLTQTASANGINALVRSFGTATCSGLAALFSVTFAVSDGRDSYPGPIAFDAVFLVAAGTAAVAAAIAFALPRGVPRQDDAGGAGLVPVHGCIRSLDHARLDRPAVVHVLTPDGQSADWARADNDGRYSVVVPGPGRYVLVANASGWSPRTVVVDIAADQQPVDIDMLVPLSITGAVSDAGEPVSGARVVLYGAGGVFTDATDTGDDGTYELPLPPMGNYVVTTISPGGDWAESRKLAVGLRRERVDLARAGDREERGEGTCVSD
ncbi:MFS transporter [Microbacterium sp. No. 7]|uniref:MFS transporter n=1 Tax=Microbacterium sp. No. 7 TaxID=1714373 RepID=UPI0006D02174|nr:MFS transporter [Microbacterium sp. No. 7]ALJ18833.1 hypothetical protein AOA12_02460 [Microbacterium sp. No. 7]